MFRFFLAFVPLVFCTLSHALEPRTLCAHLLTAHSEKNTDVPEAWQVVESKLRRKIRTGWIKRGIPNEIAETVLEHSQKVRQAALIYAAHFPGVGEPSRAALMALIHDVAEAVAPDFTPDAAITLRDKFGIEKATWDQLRSTLGEPVEPLLRLWLEYEEGKTPEAIMVKQLDRMDAAVQALRYDKLGYSQVRDFYPYTQSKVSNPTLLRIFDLLLDNRHSAVNVYDQYFALLELNGDRLRFDAWMKDEIRRLELVTREAAGL